MTDVSHVCPRRAGSAAQSRAFHPRVQPPGAGPGPALPTCRCWSGCATSASCRPTSTSSSRCVSRARSRPRARPGAGGDASRELTVISRRGACADRGAVRRLQRAGDAVAGPARHPHRQPRGAHSEAQRSNGSSAFLRARGAAAAGAGGARPGAPVPAGGQQVAELHRASSAGATRSGARTRSPSSRCRACCRA